MNKDKAIVYMICNDKEIKMTRDVFDYLMTVKHYNKKLKEEIIKLQQENEELNRMCELYSKSLYNAELTDYKSRCLKAIEILKLCNSKCAKETINILQGSDENDS